ncbi:MAG TPA: DJ-1/PfpI family protein [Thermoanaerobaculia bacterium]|nr:DJ-1/PfpI family protein [Thermoanaerobaculia bacterium]
MKIAIVAFEDFTDIDVFFMWDLLNRPRSAGWTVRIVGETLSHRSRSGLAIPMHGELEEANEADVVLFTSGPGARRKANDLSFLRRFHLDPERQMIGSICSGALILAALGLLEGKRATTYPTSVKALERFGVQVIEMPFVDEGNIATAAGCLASQYLCGWVIERHLGWEMRETVLKSVQPVGEGMSFSDLPLLQKLYAPAEDLSPVAAK